MARSLSILPFFFISAEMDDKDDWFKNWFDSDYYPLLYSHRGEEDASRLIQLIISETAPLPDSKILDLACGSGRHSRMFHEKGFQVFGYDLAPRRVQEAIEQSPDEIVFRIHDMRLPFPDGEFHLVANLFTSFGYFEKDEENLSTLSNIYESMKVGAWFVLDYLNVPYIIDNLVARNSKRIDNIDFQIQRSADKNNIFKEVKINDGEKRLSFIEKIRAFEEKDLKLLLESSGFEVIKILGDYNGKPFQPKHSQRIIFFSRKNAPR
ncbi:MAG: methyltransferase domain-containing protein [Bacteroidia bacterium]|nr:methyltransferase domain-containing protein [Bacteroidia bacterium]